MTLGVDGRQSSSMASVADLNTFIDAGIAALDAGDAAGAVRQFIKAKAVLITLPDSEQGPEQVRFDKTAIDQLIADARREENRDLAAPGLSRQKVTYVRPTG